MPPSLPLLPLLPLLLPLLLLLLLLLLLRYGGIVAGATAALCFARDRGRP